MTFDSVTVPDPLAPAPMNPSDPVPMTTFNQTDTDHMIVVSAYDPSNSDQQFRATGNHTVNVEVADTANPGNQPHLTLDELLNGIGTDVNGMKPLGLAVSPLTHDFSGTGNSFLAPQVAGAAVLLRATTPLSATDVVRDLYSQGATAVPVDPNTPDGPHKFVVFVP